MEIIPWDRVLAKLAENNYLLLFIWSAMIFSFHLKSENARERMTINKIDDIVWFWQGYE